MQLGVRLSQRQHDKLAEMARQAGATKSDIVRRLIDATDVHVEVPDAPDEGELLGILAERARAGNVGAARALLARAEESDPRARALRAFQALAEERQP
jgi:hypothetical protein